MSFRDKHAQKGLTLAEVMIALFVFSMVAAASVVVMRVSIEGRDQLAQTSGDVQQISLMRALLRSDLHQAVNRQTRDPFGTEIVEAVLGGRFANDNVRAVDGERLLLLVRQGNLNPGYVAARSDLQYVEYVVRDKQLLRRSANYPDRANEDSINERVLLRGLEEVEIEFFDGRNWVDEFISQRQLLPAAVSLFFIHPKYGEMRQVFYIPPQSQAEEVQGSASRPASAEEPPNPEETPPAGRNLPDGLGSN